ncbi:hypothetical protein LO762_21355 [Actinocorallia sp. API 0066]|uniref:hypothetical protein n=1 Tax=Actinocorallia sp. API 0066 TaxID=2896846 RepID=UPI001E2B2EE1|nr:hypothetical protein [Actinocorallia sp. API 0066]MCD0451723.1 hypothetical protein [Actinocorallia sp. API 0066]
MTDHAQLLCPRRCCRSSGRKVGGRRPVDNDKRAAILDRHRRGESIRTIATGVKVSIGVVHKTLKADRAQHVLVHLRT